MPPTISHTLHLHCRSLSWVLTKLRYICLHLIKYFKWLLKQPKGKEIVCLYTRPQGAHYKPKVPFHRSQWCAFVGGCGCLCVPQRPFSCRSGTTVNIPHMHDFEGRHQRHAALNDTVHRALALAKNTIPSGTIWPLPYRRKAAKMN